MAKPPKLDDPQAQATALSIPERILLFLELSYILIDMLFFGAAAERDRKRQRQQKYLHRNSAPLCFPYVTGASGARAKIARWSTS